MSEPLLSQVIGIVLFLGGAALMLLGAWLTGYEDGVKAERRRLSDDGVG